MQGVDYYELLGVHRHASAAEIKSAYRALARTMHPDAGGTSGTFRLLQEAYQTLNDPVRRADYDRAVRHAALGADDYPGSWDDPTSPDGHTSWHDPDPWEEPDRSGGDQDSHGDSRDGPGNGAGPKGGDKRGAAWEDAAPTGRPFTRKSGSRGSRRGRSRFGARRFGADPDFEPAEQHLDPENIPWWHTVDATEGVHHSSELRPGHAPLIGSIVLPLLLLVLILLFELPISTLVVLLIVLAGAGYGTFRVLRRYRAAAEGDRGFSAEFGERNVFGKPGAERDEAGERHTAQLMSRYLTRLPGARIFHGLAWPGSVFADVHHAVLCGKRLVLVESKMWLPGHYTTDSSGVLWRDNHRFLGGETRLADSVAAFQELLPEVEVRGALILYPSRPGTITVGDDIAIPAMTPEEFVRYVGGWLAAEASTVDHDTFRTVLGQVTGQQQ